MKPRRQLIASLFATAGLLLAGSVWADGKGAGIAGSPHDFTDNYSDETADKKATETGTGGWNDRRQEICRVCHVPHDHQKATKLYENGLLWNHKLSVASYTMYDKTWSNTLESTPSSQPDGTAKLCLGCHDGTVAIDAFDGGDGATGNVNVIQSVYGTGLKNFMVPGSSSVGDLRGTHPISIPYNAAVGGGKKLKPTETPMGSSGTTIANVLDNGKVQCSSCHDVHDQESVPGTHLLRVAQKGGAAPSGLCLTCHIK